MKKVFITIFALSFLLSPKIISYTGRWTVLSCTPNESVYLPTKGQVLNFTQTNVMLNTNSFRYTSGANGIKLYERIEGEVVIIQAEKQGKALLLNHLDGSALIYPLDMPYQTVDEIKEALIYAMQFSSASLLDTCFSFSSRVNESDTYKTLKQAILTSTGYPNHNYRFLAVGHEQNEAIFRYPANLSGVKVIFQKIRGHWFVK